MNAAELKKAMKQKKEMEAVARELGVDDILSVVSDLRSMGLLDNTERPTAIKSEPEPEPEIEVLRREQVTKIAKRIARAGHGDEHLMVRLLRNENITCAQFGYLVSHLRYQSVDEEQVFKLLVDNITDLHNFKKITTWKGYRTKSSILQQLGGLYPEIHGKEMAGPRSVTKRAKEKWYNSPNFSTIITHTSLFLSGVIIGLLF